MTDPDAATLIQRAERWLADDELQQTTPLGWHTLVRDLLARLTARETPLQPHPDDVKTPLADREVDELLRRLSDGSDPNPAHTKAWASVALQQLRAKVTTLETALQDSTRVEGAGEHRVVPSGGDSEQRIAALEAALATAQQERDWEAALKREFMPYQERAVLAEKERDALRDQVAQLQNNDAARMHLRKWLAEDALVSQLRQLIAQWRQRADGVLDYTKQLDTNDYWQCANEVEALLPADATRPP